MDVMSGVRHAVADTSIALDKTGREHLVIVLKATYHIPADGKVARPIIPPQPIQTADLFVGAPGESAPLYETDFVLRKARCDILFNARAYTRDGEPKKRIEASFSVAQCSKRIIVTGERHWVKGALGVRASEPALFTALPLHYGCAFGGSRPYTEGGQMLLNTHPENPVGQGFSTLSYWHDMESHALPNLSAPGKEIKSPDSRHEPIAFSVLPRNSRTRSRYAGTYDEAWLQDVFPFLPEDFDERYWQSAPPDQQIEYPQSGEEVVLNQLVEGRPEVRFKLPRLNHFPLKVLTADYQVLTPDLVVDTLYFDTEGKDEQGRAQPRFSVVWRATVPVRKNSREFQAIAIGAVCKDCWSARVSGVGQCRGCGEQRKADEAVVAEEEGQA